MNIESEKARLLALADSFIANSNEEFVRNKPIHDFVALVRAMDAEITRLKSVEKNLSDELTAEQEENEGWEAENEKLRARIAELEKGK